MKIIDLTHVIHPDMPVYPGTEPPILVQAKTLEKDGFKEYKMTMFSHTGTHIDAPAHILKDGLRLDQFEADQFYGNAWIIDLTATKTDRVSRQELKDHESFLKQVEFVILKTGWGRFWGTDDYYTGFPSLSLEAAEWLASFHLKGIGIDTISIDDIHAADFAVHKVFLQKNIIVIENLANLDAVRDNIFTFSCLPLNIQEGDGSPVRAVAISL